MSKWDARMLAVASLISGWSKDPSTGVGAVIVDPQNRVVSMGFNGFPRAVEDSASAMLDRDEKLRGQLAESQANDRTAMGYLSDVRQIVGGDDFPSMVANVARMAEIRCEGCGYMTHHREHMGCVRAALAAKEA